MAVDDMAGDTCRALPPPEITWIHDALVRDLRAMGLPIGLGMRLERHSEYTVHTVSRPRNVSSMMPPTRD